MIDFPMDQDKIYDLLFEDSSSESSCGAMGTPSQPENKAADTEFVEEVKRDYVVVTSCLDSRNVIERSCAAESFKKFRTGTTNVQIECIQDS